MAATVSECEKVQDACWSNTADAVATYLQETVAKTLAEGIAATIKAQPEDPPLFLSRWLLQYVEERQKQLQACSTAPKLASGEEETETIANEALPTQLDSRGLSASDNAAIEAFRGVEWVEEETIAKLLNHLKEKLGATGVYLAKYEEQLASKDENATAALKYIAADDTHSYMLNYCLLEEEGLTWDLLQDDEPDKEPEGTLRDSKEEGDGDEEEFLPEGEAEGHWESSNASGDANAKTLIRKSLIVEEVLENPRIRFFGLTRPGSYLAVSIELTEVANTDSVTALFNWMKQKRAREEAIAASQEQEETASSASGEESRRGEIDVSPVYQWSFCIGESGAVPAYSAGVEGAEEDLNEDYDALDEAHKTLAPPVLRSTRAKYVLCADSLGQEMPLDQEALQCLQLFAEEIGKTIERTQREAVERQAAEMMNANEHRVLEEQLSELQQKCSMKVQELQEQRQAEALQLLEEQEAAEVAEAERQRQEHELRQQEKAATTKTAEPMEPNKEGEKEGGDSSSVDSLSNHGESDAGGKNDEEIPIPPPLSRQCVLDAVAARAALDAFNDEVLRPLKESFSLNRRYIADSPTLVSAAAACALLLGNDVKPLKVTPPVKDALWNWGRLRQLLTPAFVDAMLEFDPAGE
ncbi:hypothetical protein, conserved [Eimeria brunetti]|uniref:Dpy-30 motif containing protein n=1 Tax=Eimeria brunetti TaxID=51314 RepID=U6LNE2_9EIME|nr:hypothetical protein, conserved [Eimeria brunetti]